MTALSRARAMGADHGRSLASALEPGDKVSPEDVPSPLSGEWAGDPLPADILSQFNVNEWGEDEILSAYEDGFSAAYEAYARSNDNWTEDES